VYNNANRILWILAGWECGLCAHVIGITEAQGLLTGYETIRFQGRNSTNLLTNFLGATQLNILQFPFANFQNHHLPSRCSVKLILCVIISLKTLSGVFVSVSGYISISRVRTL